jgi:hypothetical protein
VQSSVHILLSAVAAHTRVQTRTGDMLWHVSIDQLPDTPSVWDFLCEHIITKPSEQAYYQRYVFAEDRKRSMLSLLLQHATLRLAADEGQYEIRRSEQVRHCICSLHGYACMHALFTC